MIGPDVSYTVNRDVSGWIKQNILNHYSVSRCSYSVSDTLIHPERPQMTTNTPMVQLGMSPILLRGCYDSGLAHNSPQMF